MVGGYLTFDIQGNRQIPPKRKIPEPKLGDHIFLYKFSEQIRSKAEVLPEYPYLSGMSYLAVQ